MRFGSVTVASSGGGGTQLHTTTSKSYDPTTCLVCTGDRENHYILDNYEGEGITILIGDHHIPSVVTVTTISCVVVIRYSNTTLTDLYEYHDIICCHFSDSGEFQSKERRGFSDILQAALRERLEIKLGIASGISWLNDGPSGYVDSMQVIYDFFKFGLKGKEARS